MIFNLRCKIWVIIMSEAKYEMDTLFHWKHLYLSLCMFSSTCYNFQPRLKYHVHHLSLGFFNLFIPNGNFSPISLEFSLWAKFVKFQHRLKPLPCKHQLHFKRIGCRSLHTSMILLIHYKLFKFYAKYENIVFIIVSLNLQCILNFKNFSP